MGLTRRAQISLSYKENDISEELYPFVSSISTSETLMGGADSLSLNLNNKGNQFLKTGWALEKGERLDLLIKTLNWENSHEGVVNKKVGAFFIDSRGFNKNNVSIKSISMPLGGGYDQINSKVWSEITLESLGREVAKKYNIGFEYLCDDNISYRSLNQDKKTDFSFLEELAFEDGISLKITYNKLVLFDIEKYEAVETNRIIDLLGAEVSDWSIKERTKGIYDAIEIKFLDTASMEEKQEQYTKEQLEGEAVEAIVTEDMKVLKVNKRSTSDDLSKLARKLLKQKNDAEITIDLTITGDQNIYVGKTFFLKNAGIFDGKFMIRNLSTKLPGYTNSFTAYKILEGEDNV